MISRAAIHSSKLTIQAYQPRINLGLVTGSLPRLNRSFASQTLLSRTDYQNKSTHELREELNKRGIVTRSKKRSILIDKLLEFEPGRTITVSTTEKETAKTMKNNKATTTTSKPIEEPAATIVSSPTKIVARLMSAPDGETPKPTAIQTGSNSAPLGSPLVTVKTQGHEAQTWPASINLPSTPVEEPLGTVIPFIPDNWDSHQQSHAPQLLDIKPNPADLQVSTASHPSTLPEGGPSLIATNQFSSNPTTSRSTPSSTSTSDKMRKDDFDLDEILSKFLGSFSKSSSSSSSIKSSSSLSGMIFGGGKSQNDEPFQFEDRPLNPHERIGIFQLIAFLSGSWIFVGFFDH